jgi:hypothetical protein
MISTTPAPLASAPVSIPAPIVATAAPAPLATAPAPIVATAAPTSPETPDAKKGLGIKRPKEIPAEFYSEGHLAFLALPSEKRHEFRAKAREKVRRGLKPDGDTVIGCAELGIPVDSWRKASTVKVSATPERVRGLLTGSPIGLALAAKIPDLTWAKLAELFECSVPEARSVLAHETTPRVHAARAVETMIGGPVPWLVTPEGKAAREAREAKRRADDKAKREAKAAEG